MSRSFKVLPECRFITTVAKEKQEAKVRKAEQEELESNMVTSSSLDPLLEVLSYFSGPRDLTMRIQELYTLLDVDESGCLDLDEVSGAGKKHLRSNPSPCPDDLSVHS